MEDDLKTLLTKASEAGPANRIEYRDTIAAFGERALDGVASWLVDPVLGAFAVRVVGKVADLGHPVEAVRVLRSAIAQDPPERVKTDISAELARLAPRSSGSRSTPRGTSTRGERPTRSLEELVVGAVYGRRRDLHLHGLGGNWQKGISYPANGDYVLLFSDPAKEHEYGYKDTWVGKDSYRYFGEWDGTGDMTLTGGNAAIRDRGTDLHLFVAASGGHRYEGRFLLEGHDLELTVRDSRQFTAIVFRLTRARPA